MKHYVLLRRREKKWKKERKKKEAALARPFCWTLPLVIQDCYKVQEEIQWIISWAMNMEFEANIVNHDTKYLHILFCVLCRSKASKPTQNAESQMSSSAVCTSDLVVLTQCEGPVMQGQVTKVSTAFLWVSHPSPANASSMAATVPNKTSAAILTLYNKKLHLY